MEKSPSLKQTRQLPSSPRILISTNINRCSPLQGKVGSPWQPGPPLAHGPHRPHQTLAPLLLLSPTFPRAPWPEHTDMLSSVTGGLAKGTGSRPGSLPAMPSSSWPPSYQLICSQPRGTPFVPQTHHLATLPRKRPRSGHGTRTVGESGITPAPSAQLGTLATPSLPRQATQGLMGTECSSAGRGHPALLP